LTLNPDEHIIKPVGNIYLDRRDSFLLLTKDPLFLSLKLSLGFSRLLTGPQLGINRTSIDPSLSQAVLAVIILTNNDVSGLLKNAN
jgi:hypothetical protein